MLSRSEFRILRAYARVRTYTTISSFGIKELFFLILVKFAKIHCGYLRCVLRNFRPFVVSVYQKVMKCLVADYQAVKSIFSVS